MPIIVIGVWISQLCIFLDEELHILGLAVAWFEIALNPIEESLASPEALLLLVHILHFTAIIHSEFSIWQPVLRQSNAFKVFSIFAWWHQNNGRWILCVLPTSRQLWLRCKLWSHFKVVDRSLIWDKLGLLDLVDDPVATIKFIVVYNFYRAVELLHGPIITNSNCWQRNFRLLLYGIILW